MPTWEVVAQYGVYLGGGRLVRAFVVMECFDVGKTSGKAPFPTCARQSENPVVFVRVAADPVPE